MSKSPKPTTRLHLPDRPDIIGGGGTWPLVADHVEDWAWKTDLFTHDELDTIIRIGTHQALKKGVTFGAIQTDKVRDSSVQFLFPNEFTTWIFARLALAITEINHRFFQFDLSGMEQGLQFTGYTAPGQHYGWHVDRKYMTQTRKLSVSIQLNSPDEYEGGDLQFKFGRTNATMDKVRGMATFFPSYTLHRVTPVTKGTRYALVAWVSGPPFK